MTDERPVDPRDKAEQKKQRADDDDSGGGVCALGHAGLLPVKVFVVTTAYGHTGPQLCAAGCAENRLLTSAVGLLRRRS